MPRSPDIAGPERPEDAREVRSAAEPDFSLLGTSIDDVDRAARTTAARVGDLLPSNTAGQAPPGPSVEDSGDTGTGGVAEVETPATEVAEILGEAEDEPEAVGTPDEPEGSDNVYRFDAPAGPQSTSDAAEWRVVRPPHTPRSRGDAEAADAEADGGAVTRDAAGDEPGDREFRPAIRVDRFTWPEICRRLSEEAAAEMDRLVDRLVEAAGAGKKLAAVGSCRRGEGATTVLLSAASRAAERGRSVLIADADFIDPQLARRLGLSPQRGWEKVLSGRVSLEEVVIESTDDGLAVLPVCRTTAETDELPEAEDLLAENLESLAAAYDLVLLDPGPLEEVGALGEWLARGIGSRLDALVLVHCKDVTPPEDLDDVHRWLAASEIEQLGVVENFAQD